jgi:arylsulfatase A-like enzyme
MNDGAFGINLNPDPVSTDAPNIVTNPNILMIMADQLRVPQLWLKQTQQSTFDSLAPNITFLRQNSHQFTNFFVAAQDCTPSRATLLTGLYAPQTGMFATQDGANHGPDLNTGFPTFGNALHDIAGYNKNNILWFGKWHLFNYGTSSTITDLMPTFGFNTGRNGQILYPSTNGSPLGSANEGNNGYVSSPETAYYLGSDQAIYNDFLNNWTNNPPSEPWFICVSFVNPHDITYYPGFFYPVENSSEGTQGVPFNPNNSSDETDFVPGSNTSLSPALFTTAPAGWNHEKTSALNAKSIDQAGATSDSANFLQPYFQNDETDAYCHLPNGHAAPPVLGEVHESDYIPFLNWYYYMIVQVDQLIGLVLEQFIPGYSAQGSNTTTKTAIVFLSDHGDYAGSHGLRAKGGAVYDEVLRVPLYVSTPGKKGATVLNQMCSMVDVFRLVVELALGSTTYAWGSDPAYPAYKDQAQNQSLLSFIEAPSTPETRYFTGSDGNQYAFILTTTDETYVDAQHWNNNQTNINCLLRNHVMCMRTKSYDDLSSPASAYTGAKLAIYSKWLYSPPSFAAPIVDGTSYTESDPTWIVQDYEYYDYPNYSNRNETGNDYVNAYNAVDENGVAGSGVAAQQLLSDMSTALGNLQIRTAGGTIISPASGYVATLLTSPLQGVYNGSPLSQATVAGITAWYTWAQGVLGCSS